LEKLDLFAQKIQIRSLTMDGTDWLTRQSIVNIPLRANSRLSGIIGNFAELAALWLFAASKDGHVTGVWPKFPVTSIPRIFWGEPGRFRQGDGNSCRRLKNGGRPRGAYGDDEVPLLRC
jgi:hypothetical protein